MTVITVSRQLGSHGGEIGAGVAKRLGLRFVDREVIRHAPHPPYAGGFPTRASGLYTSALRGHHQPCPAALCGHHGRLHADGGDGDPRPG